jgi:hypothetical protein
MGTALADRPQALVYRGPAVCDGCAEAVGTLLESSPSNFNVTYVGPKGDVDITSETLSNADLYAQGGGGGKFPLHMHCDLLTVFRHIAGMA